MRFNAREIDRLLSLMEPEVACPNGMDGGCESGRDAVRAFWTRQWGRIAPQVMPQRVDAVAESQVGVRVRQVIRDLAGRVLRDGLVTHVYTLRGGRVITMEIQPETE